MHIPISQNFGGSWHGSISKIYTLTCNYAKFYYVNELSPIKKKSSKLSFVLEKYIFR